MKYLLNTFQNLLKKRHEKKNFELLLNNISEEFLINVHQTKRYLENDRNNNGSNNNNIFIQIKKETIGEDYKAIDFDYLNQGKKQ